MAMSATCYFLILDTLRFPVKGAPGEILSVWPVAQNLWVFDATGDWVIRRAAFDEGKLWTVLDDLLERGVIRFLDEHELLRRPLPVAFIPAPPMLRVIRTG